VLLCSAVTAVLIALLGVAALGAGASTNAWTVATVASGLDAPRGVALLPNGMLLVAEAGHGGDVCRPDVDNGVPITRCIGTTSRISSVNVSTGARRPSSPDSSRRPGSASPAQTVSTRAAARS
jgi:glucose/arabinose dehydrogenase